MDKGVVPQPERVLGAAQEIEALDDVRRGEPTPHAVGAVQQVRVGPLRVAGCEQRRPAHYESVEVLGPEAGRLVGQVVQQAESLVHVVF